VGGHYELTGSQVTKYYFAGAQRVAMRKYTIPQSMSVEYLLGDHLGSTSLTTDTNGAKVSEMRYKAWGEIRYSWTAGQSTTPAYKLAKYTFTGQYSYMDDPSTGGVTEGFGLMFYNARMYDPYLNHFTQPDTIVPDPYNPQDWDRYSYARYNPLKYTDPSGHCVICSLAIFFTTVVAQPLISTALGSRPDYEGILITMALTDTDNAVVAAGLSIQSEFPWAIIGGDATGFAQALPDELRPGENPFSPSDSVNIMDRRIMDAINACRACKTETDNLILAAIAQNGGLDLETIRHLPTIGKNGPIDWKTILSEWGGNTTDNWALARQNITGMKYNTKFMLQLFMNDLEVLLNLGYTLPEEFDGANLDDVYEYLAP
jgi:RHS repeat-associated protein